jgi:hypothetical protein
VQNGLLKDLQNRVNFALEKPSHPINGIPWSQTWFEDAGKGEYGDLRVFPTVDDRIIMSVSTSGMIGSQVWTCDIIAEGKVQRDGSAVMKALGETGPDLRFQVRSVGRNIIVIKPLTYRPSEFCGLNGNFYSTYRAHGSPRRGGKRR